MPPLEALWNSTPFWGIMGLIGGVIVSSIFFFAGKKRKILEYEIISTPLITKNTSSIPGLKVTIDDVPVKTLTSTTIHFFNMGSEKIELTDFAPLEPLEISASKSIVHLQLAPNVSDRHNRNLNLRLKFADDHTVTIAFDFFRAKKSFSMIVMHEGALSIHGDLKDGIVRPHRSRPFFSTLFKIMLVLFPACALIGSCIFSMSFFDSLCFSATAFICTIALESVAFILDSPVGTTLYRIAHPYEDEDKDEENKDL